MKGFLRRFARNRGALAGLVVLAAVVAAAVLASFVAPDGPWDMAARPFLPPSLSYTPLGTDTLGRDILAGILYGARVSLVVGVVSTAFALLLGMLLGGLAGLFGGNVDAAIMRITEVFQTIPSFMLAILLVAVFEPSVTTVILTIAIVTWPPIARLTRAEFMSVKSRDYVAAAVSAGRSHADIAIREILPNALPPLIVMGTLGIATAILLESAFSFLGLSDPNVISWGYMVGSGRTLLRQAWWISVCPGLAIIATVLAVNLVGEGMNDALDARLQRAASQ